MWVYIIRGTIEARIIQGGGDALRGVFCARMPPPWVMVRWTKGGKRPQSSTTTSSTALTCAQQTDPGGFPSTKDEAHSQCVCRVETPVDGKKQRSTTNAAGGQLHVPSSLLPLDFEFREFRCFLQLEYQLACARREVLQQLADVAASRDEACEAREEPQEELVADGRGSATFVDGLVVNLCQCKESGVCASSRQHPLPAMEQRMRTRRARIERPLEAFGVRACQASHTVSCVPDALLEAVCTAVRELRIDDDIVHQNGLQGPWVHLKDAGHPSCTRVRMSLCQDGCLNIYGPSANQKPGTISARHMTPFWYEVCACLAASFQEEMPSEFQGLCPDMVTVQFFSGSAFMGWHTDSRPTPGYTNQIISQKPGSPVLSLNLFEDFLFCTVPIQDGGVVDKQMTLKHSEAHAILLKHGDVMMWPVEDDHSHKHSVRPPPACDQARFGPPLRVSVVARFSNDARPKRRFAPEFPYRILEEGGGL